MEKFGFNLYQLFIVSWFLHLTSRFPALGIIRFDLLLILILFWLSFAEKSSKKSAKDEPNETVKILKILIIYTILTIPVVEWPGSVIRTGIPNFIKAIVFFFFTVKFVTSKDKLDKFIYTFLLCQTFRVFEPVYLHLTEGYWGSRASMAGWEYMDRLSGAPYDVINPNGLAFVIDTVIPFFYFLFFISWKNKIISSIAMPVCIYALVLTGSRSGLIGLLIILLGIWFKSKRKTLFACIMVVLAAIIFVNLSANMQDRYFSIFSSNTKSAATAKGRLSGIVADFNVALHRPFFGHGLGTSLEANANFGGKAQISHNLFAEISQELGFIGLILYLFFIKSILSNFTKSIRIFKHLKYAKPFLFEVNNAMQVWLGMNIVFSFASYGLSSYEWYLFAGLSVVTLKLAKEEKTVVEAEK